MQDIHSGGCKNLADITWKGHINFSTLPYCFYGCSAIEELPEIGDQPYCASLSYTFCQCSRLKHIVLGRFPSCTSITHTFEFDMSLEEVYMSELSGVGDASNAFNQCKSLSGLSLSSFGQNCTSFATALNGCIALTGTFTLPDMLDCTSFGAAFNNCGLSEITIGNTPSVTSIATICQNNKNLRKFKMGQSPLVASSNASFQNCKELEDLELHIPNNTLNYTQDMFSNCSKLKKLKGEARLKADGPSAATYWGNMFNYCRNLEELPDIFPSGGWAASFPTASVTFSNCFSNCVSLTGTVPSWIWETWPGRQNNQFNTFLNCFKLDNFNDISTYWKGGNITV